MVRLIVLTSVASVQLALLVQISMGLPIPVGENSESANGKHCKRAPLSSLAAGGIAAAALCATFLATGVALFGGRPQPSHVDSERGDNPVPSRQNSGSIQLEGQTHTHETHAPETRAPEIQERRDLTGTKSLWDGLGSRGLGLDELN